MLSMYFFFFCSISSAYAFFTEHFANFLENNYGSTFKDILQRSDMGKYGSFGGKRLENDSITHDPVIFVHGVSDVAGMKMLNVATKYKTFGYTDAELYSTTYAYGSRLNPLQWTLYSMKCEYVKQIRALILAVRYYTRRNVDIVAFSLGVPIARKATLGGDCVDTGEDLGGPLTRYVDTFLAIAGPNHGITFNVVGIPLPTCALGTLPICDRVVGLYSGLCPRESEFLNDINEEFHYEGKHVYSIYSYADEMVGYRVCGKVTASIDGEDNHKSFENLKHDDVLETTSDLQIMMIQGRFEDKTISKSKMTTTTAESIESSTTTSTTSTTDSDRESSRPTLNREGLSISDVELDRAKTDLLSRVGKEQNNESRGDDGMDKIRKYFREQSNISRDSEITPDAATTTVEPLGKEDVRPRGSANLRERIVNAVPAEGVGYRTRILFTLQ